MLLVELMHAETGVKGKLDISNEQEQVRDLLSANRLYKQSALKIGEAGVSDVLDDLERVLVEVANGPSELNQKELEQLRQQIEGQGILMKVRVLGSKVKSESKRATRKERHSKPASKTGHV